MKTKSSVKPRKIVQQLHGLGACADAMIWVEATPGSGQQLRKSCESPEWMLCLAGKTVDKDLIIRAGIDCARTALKYVQKGEDRPRLALEAAEGFLNGTVTRDQVASAAASAASASYFSYFSYASYSSYVAFHVSYVSHASSSSASYSSYVAFHVSYVSHASSAAAAAASASSAAASFAASAAYAAREKHRKLCCDLIRKRISWAIISKGFKA